MTSGLKLFVAIAVAVGTFFAARTAYLGYAFLRPVQFWDQLHSVDQYLTWQEGIYRLSVFWSFHNEHRILIPRLMSLIDAVYFDFTNRFLIASIYAGLFIITLSVAALALKRRSPARTTMMTLALLGIGWNVAQYENLTWGFQTPWVLVHLFALGCFFCFGEMLAAVAPRRRAMWLALACANDVLGMLSLAGGVLIGVAAMSMCLPLRAWNRWVGAFIAFHAAAVAGYFVGMSRHPGSHGADLLDTGRYFLRCLGSIARAQPHVPALLGLALLSAGAFLAVHTLRKTADRCGAILVAVILLVIIEAAATTAGRATLGVDQALTSRYATQSAILVMAVLALCWRALPALLPRCAVMAAAVALTVLANDERNIREAEDIIAARDTAMLSFINGVYAPSQTSRIYTDTALVERAYEKLAELRKGPFALSATVYQPPLNSTGLLDIAKLPACSAYVDAATRHDRWTEAWGWIGASGWVLAYTDSGRLVGYTISSIRRPDVAAALALTEDRVGFDLFLNNERIGGDRLRLIAVTGTPPSPCVFAITSL